MFTCYVNLFTGNDLICLDPHVTQPTVNLTDSFDDSSYHIPYGSSKRMPIKDIDPSISLVCVWLSSFFYSNFYVQFSITQ